MSRAKQPNAPKAATSSGKGTAASLSWKERIHPEDYEQLRTTFEQFDIDKSGFIDPEEISKIMEELGESRKGTLIWTIIDSLRYKNKPINFEEFVEIVTPKIGDVKTKEGIRTIFKHLDLDEDDYINYDELKKLSRMAGDAINDEEILELLHSTFINNKTNNNEGLYFEEFYMLVTKYYQKRG
jgi:Ca2+-binding EF-hand superfamily protein